MIAQPIGYAEISLGRVTGTRVDVECANLARTPTAKPVTSIKRSYWLEGESLNAETTMGMEGIAPVRHLRVKFDRVT